MKQVVSIVARIHARLQRSKYLTAMCVIGVLIVHKDGWPGLRTAGTFHRPIVSDFPQLKLKKCR